MGSNTARRARLLRAAALPAVLALAGCGGDDGPDPVAAAPAPTPAPTTAGARVSSLGADGWASTGGGTTGGDGATAARTYTVTNRNELVQALYGNTAVIAEDGSITGGTLDPSRKLIYVSGTVSLNVNRALTEQTADAYVLGSCASATYGYRTDAALQAEYIAAYRPSVWGNAAVPSGRPESARVCAQQQQRRVVALQLPSNTSILGIGADARIVHGNLLLGTNSVPVENVVLRNLSFEDSFDFFPQWDPTDSTTGRWNSAYDLISVINAQRVWIDHNNFSDAERTDDRFPSVFPETVNGVDYRGADFKVQHHDGLVDVTRLGNLVTVSNNLMFNHDKVSLVGGSDTASRTAENPDVLKVTYSGNWFRDLRQRLPRVRYGQVHVYNNLYTGTRASSPYGLLVAWTVGQSGKIYAENNVFAVPDASVDNLYSTSISAARTTACVALGYSAAQCASTFYAAGTLLNGVAVDVQTPLLARFPAVTQTGWRPASFYSYTAREPSAVEAIVRAYAGVGRL
jgi:pectate lyase